MQTLQVSKHRSVKEIHIAVWSHIYHTKDQTGFCQEIHHFMMFFEKSLTPQLNTQMTLNRLHATCKNLYTKSDRVYLIKYMVVLCLTYIHVACIYPGLQYQLYKYTQFCNKHCRHVPVESCFTPLYTPTYVSIQYNKITQLNRFVNFFIIVNFPKFSATKVFLINYGNGFVQYPLFLSQM